jgi:hypothetical protein
MSVLVNENQLSAITLIATDENSIIYSISDEINFELNSSTGVVKFRVAPDYETKNLYKLIATASDSFILDLNYLRNCFVCIFKIETSK